MYYTGIKWLSSAHKVAFVAKNGHLFTGKKVCLCGTYALILSQMVQKYKTFV
jgi:hypothetical protein